MSDYAGIRAVITGGGSGIGAATAAELVSRGARVAVLDRDTATVRADMLALTCDLSNGEQVHASVRAVVEAFGGIDVVVNNAGIGASGTVADNDDTEWAHVLDVNVTAMARVSREVLPYLLESDCASIVNTSSAVAYVGVTGRALYSASKAAVIGLTLAMAADHVESAIRVNAVAPGTVETPWVDRLLREAADPNAAAEALRRRQPIGRLVQASEVARAIAYLGSPLSGSTTGTVLRVDGGMTSLRIS